MSDSPITIQIDGRIRLIAALLSITTWPYQEQDLKPHDVHAHAKATRKHLAESEEHPAATILQELLESGRPLDDIFSYTNAVNWPNIRARGSELPEWAPKDWSAQLRDFMHSTKLKELWERDSAVWDSAVEESKKALNTGDPLSFLGRFFGKQEVKLVFQPNLAFPTDRALSFRRDDEIVCICPPRISWGHNPPWPYDDDPAATYADAMLAYSRALLREYLDKHPEETEAVKSGKLPIPNTFRARFPEWFDQFAVLFTNGVTAIFLEETFSKPEAASFKMMVQKANGFDVLPSVVDVLQRYLEGHKDGKYKEFSEYMPIFSKGLALAESMRNL